MSKFANPEDPEVISEADAADLQRRGILAPDPDRTLPLWFDGRFLTARDLNRQQSYFLSRHSALGRSIGSGVIEGLDLLLDESGGGNDVVRVAPGQGITFDGAHIHLPTEMTLKLSDVGIQSELNTKLGLSVHPSTPLSSRNGLFVLSLRAVEYTANETASFPNTTTGERTTQMGDKVEAVAATLTPYAPAKTTLSSLDSRADAAHRIFADGRIDGLPAFALPLAMMSIKYGVIEWVDVHMVRRELAIARNQFLGLGLSQDQLRMAHFQQYRGALSDVLDHYVTSNQPARFPASQHFNLLPPAGPLPADAVDPAAMTQVFFPGEVEVELSVIPDDELPALIEESFELPPIDLTRPVEERDSLSVMIVAPMPRHALRSQLGNLNDLTKPLRPLSMLGKGPQKPLDRLGAMKVSLADAAAHRAPSESVAAREWADIVGSLTNFGIDGDTSKRTLWYMRRRTLRRSADLESVLIAVQHTDHNDDGDVTDPVDPVVDPVVDPTPDPTPTPTPDADELDDKAKAALLKLAGFGDLAKIGEVQMRRVTKTVRGTFVEAVLETELAEDAVSMTAVIARMADNNANANARLKNNIKSILDASGKGRATLSAGLIGQGTQKVGEEQFERLQTFVVEPGQLEGVANALPKLDRGTQSELVIELAKLVSEREKDEVQRLSKDIVEKGKAADNPAPTPDPVPTPGPTPDPTPTPTPAETQRERQSRQQAKQLVDSITHSPDKTRMKATLDKANTNQRLALATSMNRAKVATSRIATGAALNALATGGQITDQQIRLVRAINGSIVSGIKVFEPGLLKVEAAPAPSPSPSRGRGGRTRSGPRLPGGVAGPIRGLPGGALGRRVDTGGRVIGARVDESRISELIRPRTASTVDKRVSLLSRARRFRSLAVFGARNKSKAAKIKAVTKDLIAALDKPGATVGSIDSAILATLRRNQ